MFIMVFFVLENKKLFLKDSFQIGYYIFFILSSLILYIKKYQLFLFIE